MTTDPNRLRRTISGVAALCATFGVAVAVAAIWIGDRPGFAAALAFAVAFTLPSSIAGWLIARQRVTGAARAVAGPLAGVVVRILPPLFALGLLTTERGAAVRAAGAGPMIVGFYLALLATDILLHMMAARTQTRRPRSAEG